MVPDFATENKEKITLPKKLSNNSFSKEIWQEYGTRCIGCGRCDFACPTCTCFTMQDIFYKDNPKAGEQIWVSHERKMCCGLGKCGHCKVGSTYICLDGPVSTMLKARN